MQWKKNSSLYKCWLYKSKKNAVQQVYTTNLGNYKKICISKTKKRIVFVIMRYCEYQLEEGKTIAYTLLNGKTRLLANDNDENYILLAVCQLREIKKCLYGTKMM